MIAQARARAGAGWSAIGGASGGQQHRPELLARACAPEVKLSPPVRQTGSSFAVAKKTKKTTERARPFCIRVLTAINHQRKSKGQQVLEPLFDGAALVGEAVGLFCDMKEAREGVDV